MKRKLFVLLAVLAVLFSLFAAVFAAETPSNAPPHQMTVSDDLAQVEIDGRIYVRANTTMLDGSYYVESTMTTITKQEQYSSIIAKYAGTGLVRVEYTYTDGTMLRISYLREDLVGALEELLVQENYIVNFYYPYGNSVGASKNDLRGETIGIPSAKYYSCTTFDVYAKHPDTGLRINKGELIIMDDCFYYIDYAENGVSEKYDLTSNSQITAHRVTDQSLLSRLETSKDRYYDDTYGWLEDPDVGDSASDYSIVILFAIFPAAALVVFGIFFFKSKQKVYRRICLMVCSWAVLVLAVLLSLILIF